MWALGNHKTQSLWSIPEPLPLYIAFFSSTHNLSPFHSCSLTHNTNFIFFPSTFHLSSASATPHLCPPSPPPTLTLSLCFIIYYSSLLFVSAHWTFFLSPPHPSPPPPLSPLTWCPYGPTLPNTSLLLKPSHPLLPSSPSNISTSRSPLPLPSITRVCGNEGGVLIARSADRHP